MYGKTVQKHVIWKTILPCQSVKLVIRAKSYYGIFWIFYLGPVPCRACWPYLQSYLQGHRLVNCILFEYMSKKGSLLKDSPAPSNSFRVTFAEHSCLLWHIMAMELRCWVWADNCNKPGWRAKLHKERGGETKQPNADHTANPLKRKNNKTWFFPFLSRPPAFGSSNVPRDLESNTFRATNGESKIFHPRRTVCFSQNCRRMSLA